MFVDFGMAVQYGGVCYLRFDDTNPEAEKQVDKGACPASASLDERACCAPGCAPFHHRRHHHLTRTAPYHLVPYHLVLHRRSTLTTSRRL